MIPKTTLRYPRQTGHQRPQQRLFFIWRDPHIRYRQGHRPWRWCCTLCEPPSFGFRSRPGAWARIITVTLPRHMRVRRQHHAWVKKNQIPPGGRGA